MNWDDLRIFLAATRARTWTSAAKQLGVNQTTVTRRLQSLQSTFGVRLFDRTGDGYVLTDAGVAMQQTAGQIEEALAALDRQVLGKDTHLSGALRVTTTDLVANLDIELINSFTQQFPGIELELCISDSPYNITKREADVAIRWTNEPQQQLVGRRLVRAEYALYGAVTLVGQRSKKAELADFPWLMWDESKEARITKAWMDRHVPNARIACRLDSSISFLTAVKAGIGIAFLPCVYGDSDPLLRRLRPIEPGFGVDIWLLTHPDLRNNARIRAFNDHAVRYFTSRIAQFAGKK